MTDAFKKFRARLVERISRADWPDPASEWWGDLERTLAAMGATPHEADQVLARLFVEPPRWLSDVPGALVAGIQSIRAAKGTSGPVGTLDEARQRAWGCPECGGTGLTGRWTWIPRKNLAASCGYCCHRCDAGAWLAEHYRTRPRGETRIPSLADYPELQDERLRDGWIVPAEEYAETTAPPF